MVNYIRNIWQAATKSERAIMVGCLAYMFWPFDLFPEAIFGVFGLTDDAAALVLLINKVRQIRSRLQPE